TFFHSLLWAAKAWGLLAILVALLAAVFWALPAPWKATVSGSMPGFVRDFPREWNEHRTQALLSLARIIAFGLVLTALVYETFANNWIWRVHQAFNRQFERLRRFYGGFLALALEH